MERILVAYATNSGSTEEVARVIAEEIRQAGHEVDLSPLEAAAGLENYSLVVVGAPMILGWHRAARNFLREHQQVLSQRRVACFFTAMSLTQTGQEVLEGIPLAVDPRLAKPPQKPGRLNLKERYALPQNYLRPVLRRAPQVRPVSAGFFGGKLELFRLKWYQMLFVMLVIGAQPGDRRNWDFIRGWARSLAAAAP